MYKLLCTLIVTVKNNAGKLLQKSRMLVMRIILNMTKTVSYLAHSY